MLQAPLTELVIDVSRYQARIDPAELISGGVKGVIVKCGQDVHEDSKYSEHARAVKAAGLRFEAYYWPDPTFRTGEQVDTALRLYEKEMPAFLWLDCEQYWAVWGEYYQAWQKQIEWAAVTRIAPKRVSDMNWAVYVGLKDRGVPVGIYTRASFINSYAPDMKNWIKDIPVWACNYPYKFRYSKMDWLGFNDYVNYDISIVGMTPIPGASNIVGWQFTGDQVALPGTYSNSGIYSNTDVSLFSAEWMGGVAPVYVKPPYLYEAICTAGNGLHVRSAPSLLGRHIRWIYAPERVKVMEASGGWSRIGDGEWAYSSYLKRV